MSELQSTNKLRNRKWFDLGGRHGAQNRIADFGPVFDHIDCSTLTASDIGAAEGDITQWLADRFSSVHAHELMDQAYSQLAQRFQSNPRVTTFQTDITQSPLAEPTDATYLLGVLHYFNTEELRHQILNHCLENSRYLFITRTGIRDFRQRDHRRMELAHRYTTLKTFIAAAQNSFDLCIIDNAYRGTDSKRLGDLVIYRKNTPNNPFPPLQEMFGSTPGCLNRDALDNHICCDQTDPK